MSKVTRRGFIRTAGLAATGAVVGGRATANAIVRPEIVSSEAMQSRKKVNMAYIGIANQGAADLRSFQATGLANPVAVCDVDLDSRGAQASIKDLAPKAKQFRDYREMFDKMSGDIDAVLVATPDFSHFPICMAAMQLGKHVYVEKPLTRTFLEAELLKRMAENNPKLVTQMGNQGHSGEQYFQFKAWLDAGIIKDVTKVIGHMNNSRRWHPWDPNITRYPEAQPLPEGMTEKDWDTWLSQSFYHDFNEKYHPGNWRGWWDFGCGCLGDWGFHILDTVHEFLDLGYPYEINPIYLTGHNDYFYPMSETLLFRFPSRGDMPAVDIEWYDGVDNLPELPEGYDSVEAQTDSNIPFSGGAAEGMGGASRQQTPQGGASRQQTPQGGASSQGGGRRLSPGKIIYSKELTFKGGSHSAPLSIIPVDKANQMASRLPDYPKDQSNHYENFLKACLGEEKTRSPFELVAPLSQTFSLGIIAARLNKKLLFNSQTKEITNDQFANSLLAWTPPRKGWEQYYNI
jgi:predicted dehydrogenase